MSEREPTTVATKSHRYPCPGCGADLIYNPADSNLSCPYCGRVEQIPTTAEEAKVQERSYEEYLQPRQDQLETMADNALEVTCKSCGATVTFTPPEVAGECAFCGTAIVAQPRSADPLVAPEGVLPFRVTRPQATDELKKWLASRWFAPNALKKLAYQESIGGVYLPFWTFDSNTVSFYSGERGEYYYVTETYTDTDSQGNQVTRTRQVRHTRWYPASGQVERWFDDLLVAATVSVPKPRLIALEPWDLPELKAYEPAYLAGYKAQRYTVKLPDAFEEAKAAMASVIDSDVRKDIGGDEQRVNRIDTSYSAITFKHILLPVYLAAYRFNQKVFQVMINARTGEVQGDRPYSIWKIALLIIAILLVIGLIIFLKAGRK